MFNLIINFFREKKNRVHVFVSTHSDSTYIW